MKTTVNTLNLLLAARDLLSEDGENVEYDRAIANLVTDACGLGCVEPEDVLDMLRLVD